MVPCFSLLLSSLLNLNLTEISIGKGVILNLDSGYRYLNLWLVISVLTIGVSLKVIRVRGVSKIPSLLKAAYVLVVGGFLILQSTETGYILYKYGLKTKFTFQDLPQVFSGGIESGFPIMFTFLLVFFCTEIQYLGHKRLVSFSALLIILAQMLMFFYVYYYEYNSAMIYIKPSTTYVPMIWLSSLAGISFIWTMVKPSTRTYEDWYQKPKLKLESEICDCETSEVESVGVEIDFDLKKESIGGYSSIRLEKTHGKI